MNKCNKKDNFKQIIDELISEGKFGEAINFLQNILEKDQNNKTVLVLMEQLKKIVEYQNRDIFGSTNIDMDPWLE
ncbi:MAG: hypothetical protein JXN62_04055 [Bacteroidales bacterium]|nr:hypothetical protein [Bacteroidales bacterium]